nr:DUF6323 family protein [uncultured Cellulosilyticum sp.]
MKDFLPQALISQIASSEIMACNKETKKYGLILTQEDVGQILERRKEALLSYGRIEIGGGIIPKLIEIFCDSPYLEAQNYESTIEELVETFYYFKNEALDTLSDEELLKLMRQYFDEYCGGDIELLQQSALEQLTRNIRYGHEDYTQLDERAKLYLGDDLNEY